MTSSSGGGSAASWQAQQQEEKQLCLETLQQSIQVYYYLVAASLGLTVLSVGTYRLCLRSRLEGAPGLAAQYFFVTGTVKVTLGLLLLLVLEPKCPPPSCSSLFVSLGSGSNDDDNDDVCLRVNMPSPLYGLVASAVGALWLARGCERLAVARALVSNRTSNNSIYSSAAEASSAADGGGGGGDGATGGGTMSKTNELIFQSVPTSDDEMGTNDRDNDYDDDEKKTSEVELGPYSID